MESNPNILTARCSAGTCLQREINADGSVTLRSTTGLGGELTITAEEWRVAVAQIAESPTEWSGAVGTVTAGEPASQTA